MSPRPCTRLTVPAGKPTSSSSCTNSSAQSGAYSDGFQTTVQPAARPYTIGMPAMSTGKFHGETAATTPTGSCTTMMRLRPSRSCVDGSTWPAWRSMSSAARRKWSQVNSSISSRASRIVLPTSRAMVCAISSLRSRQIAYALRQSSTRSTTDVRRQDSKAASRGPHRAVDLRRRSRPARCRAARRSPGSGPRSPRPRRHPFAGDERAPRSGQHLGHRPLRFARDIGPWSLAPGAVRGQRGRRAGYRIRLGIVARALRGAARCWGRRDRGGRGLAAESSEATRAASTPADVRLEGVTKRFGEVTAVDDLTLEIPRGAFFAMLGPVGLRQDDDAAHDRRLRAAHRGPRLPRRAGRHGAAALQARRQHRLPELRAVPAPVRGGQRRVRPARAQGRGRRAAPAGGRGASSSRR